MKRYDEVLIRLEKQSQEELNQIMFEAIKLCNKELLKLSILLGANVNARDSYAIKDAVTRDDIEILKILIDNGIDKDEAIKYVAENGFAEMVSYLIGLGACVTIDSNYALRMAAANGYAKVVKLLIKAGADVTANNNYALKWASKNGHKEVVNVLIENGADAKADNSWALYLAIEEGHLEVAKILMNAGATL